VTGRVQYNLGKLIASLMSKEAKVKSGSQKGIILLRHIPSWGFIVLLTCLALIPQYAILSEPVVVRNTQGFLHGFLVLRTLDGKSIADGDLTQTTKADRVTDHLVFHFKDRSLYDETAVFTQHGAFRLMSDHLIQKGPAFKRQMDTLLDAGSGQVTTRYMDEDAKEKVVKDQLTLPTDLANGMIPVLLSNFPPNAQKSTLSMVVVTPKPRIVKLAISSMGEESFSIGGSSRKAMHYVIKIELGGPAGVVAPLVGKQPPDSDVWILAGEAPVFLKSEATFYEGGPIWRVESVAPVWP